MKEYKKRIWSKFLKAIREYDMVQDGDRIAVGVSGGKDSLLLMKLFKELKKDRSRNFEVFFITLDPGFKEKDIAQFELNIKELEDKVNIYDTNIWEIAFTKSPENPCFFCAKMRRGILYKKAEDLGCNKLALAHHFDDLVETVLINMFCAGTIKTMLPKVKSESGNFELIRPMCFIKEESIKSFMSKQPIKPMNCGCSIEEGEKESKRKEIKELLKKLEKQNPNIKQNIFTSIGNINLNYVMGYSRKDF